MLTLSQEVVISNFAKEFIKLIQFAIKNKPIKRISRRKVKGKYIDKVFSAPVNASGELAKTLRYEITNTSLSIYANDYIYDLVYGKAPSNTAMGIDFNLESKIKKWIGDKGISSENISDDNLSHLIANKIQKFGSSIYLAHKGGNSGLLENIINDNLIRDYNSKFTKQLSEDFKAAFNNG
jgi:hypothetical protein